MGAMVVRNVEMWMKRRTSREDRMGMGEIRGIRALRRGQGVVGCTAD